MCGDDEVVVIILKASTLSASWRHVVGMCDRRERSHLGGSGGECSEGNMTMGFGSDQKLGDVNCTRCGEVDHGLHTPLFQEK